MRRTIFVTLLLGLLSSPTVGAHIAAGTIDASKLNVATLSAISANIGTVTAGNISGVTIAAGAGNVVLDTAGITLTPGALASNRIKWSNGAGIYGSADGAGTGIWLGGIDQFVIGMNAATYHFGSGALYGFNSPIIDLGHPSAPWNDLYIKGLIRAPAQYGGGGTRFVCVANDGAFFAQDAPC